MTTASAEAPDERANTHPDRPQADIPADTFAARLVLSRHHAGQLSIEKAAARCGINAGNWAHWERGRRPLDKVDVARAISDGLGIDFDWLLFGGPLTGARGVPTRAERTVGPNFRYGRAPVRPSDTRPIGGPVAGPRTRPPSGPPRAAGGPLRRRAVRISEPLVA